MTQTLIYFVVVVAVVLVVGSYRLHKLRERGRPRATLDPANENIFFERFFPKPISGQSKQPL